VEKIVRDLYEDEGINGILVQLPLPGHLNPHKICDIIGADKDVDGLNPINVAGIN
jgi:5,10-methylene-tetrahydrofolate dehydrogenase/methenyl tetrahydrofolate cyclohydrolase